MGILIRPSAIIRQNYNVISDLCKDAKEPVFLTKNGKGDLVVMDIGVFNERERQLEIRERLVEAEEMRLMGVRDVSAESVCDRLRRMLKGSYDGAGGRPYVSG